MVFKETDYNTYIVLIEKYLETIRFDGLGVETSKRRIILCYLQNSVSATKNHQL